MAEEQNSKTVEPQFVVLSNGLFVPARLVGTVEFCYNGFDGALKLGNGTTSNGAPMEPQALHQVGSAGLGERRFVDYKPHEPDFTSKKIKISQDESLTKAWNRFNGKSAVVHRHLAAMVEQARTLAGQKGATHFGLDTVVTKAEEPVDLRVEAGLSMLAGSMLAGLVTYYLSAPGAFGGNYYPYSMDFKDFSPRRQPIIAPIPMRISNEKAHGPDTHKEIEKYKNLSEIPPKEIFPNKNDRHKSASTLRNETKLVRDMWELDALDRLHAYDFKPVEIVVHPTANFYVRTVAPK